MHPFANKLPLSASGAPPPSARLNPESVHVVAQSISHLPPVSDAGATALALDTEYRIRQIVQDAIKFMKHAKRARLQPNDINAALRLRNVEPVYGFCAPPTTRDRHASETLGSTPVLIPRVQSPPSSREPGFATVQGSPNLFFAYDTELNLRTELEAPLPALPLEVTVNAHWLAIDSTQPRISQNPVKLKSALESTSCKSSTPTAPTAVSSGAVRNSTTRDVPDHAPPSVQTLAARAIVKPNVKHVLSRELQLYYESLTAIFYANDTSRLQACMASVADEPGIVQLLPYFSAFISSSVRSQIHNLPLLLSNMRLFSAILDNKAFPLERYLHQLLPAIITCLVGKRLCSKPNQNHWALRDYSASIIRRICARFGPSYTSLQGRITRTLVDALDAPKRPLTTHYGAIVGLASLGPIVVDDMLSPRLEEYSRKVLAVLDNPTQKPIRRMEAGKVYGALAWALSILDKRPNGAANGVGIHTVGKDLWSFELDDVSIIPKEVNRSLPNFEKLLPSLKRDHGKRLYPFGEGLSPSQLTEAIAAEVEGKDNNTNS